MGRNQVISAPNMSNESEQVKTIPNCVPLDGSSPLTFVGHPMILRMARANASGLATIACALGCIVGAAPLWSADVATRGCVHNDLRRFSDYCVVLYQVATR